MPSRESFSNLLQKRWDQAKTLVCIGLDSDYEHLPESVKISSGSESGAISSSLFRFNKEIVDATWDLVCCYKPQIAFYAAKGEEGLKALQQTIKYIHNTYPSIPVMVDAKRSDIGSTTEQYAIELFEVLRADAATLIPFLGRDSCEPFLKLKEKGLFFICHTSNPGAIEFQELQVSGMSATKTDISWSSSPMPLYEYVASKIAKEWNNNKNCGLVIGATFPKQLSAIRELVGDMPLLIPGVGAQQGDVKSTVRAGRNSRGHGMIISSSRAIIFASDKSDFANAARNSALKLRDMINTYR